MAPTLSKPDKVFVDQCMKVTIRDFQPDIYYPKNPTLDMIRDKMLAKANHLCGCDLKSDNDSGIGLKEADEYTAWIWPTVLDPEMFELCFLLDLYI